MIGTITVGYDKNTNCGGVLNGQFGRYNGQDATFTLVGGSGTVQIGGPGTDNRLVQCSYYTVVNPTGFACVATWGVVNCARRDCHLDELREPAHRGVAGASIPAAVLHDELQLGAACPQQCVLLSRVTSSAPLACSDRALDHLLADLAADARDRVAGRGRDGAVAAGPVGCTSGCTDGSVRSAGACDSRVPARRSMPAAAGFRTAAACWWSAARGVARAR